MFEKNVVMSFKDVSGKKVNLTVKHAKEDIAELDILALMDNVITNKLIKTENGDLVEKVSAEVVTKETTEVAI